MPVEQAIVIKHGLGQMANRMFQFMLATELQHRVGRDIPIYGYDIPEWDLKPNRPDGAFSGPAMTLKLQNFNLDEVAMGLKLRLLNKVVISGWGMRLSHYRDPAFYAELFTHGQTDFYRPADDEIVLHVRAADIMTGYHPRYFPMPVAYYREVIANSGLKPVFIGQIYEGAYAALLREAFPEAKFLPSASATADFQTIRHARHVGLSVSSFCWLATWLSKTAETVHMPVCGLFFPVQNGARCRCPSVIRAIAITICVFHEWRSALRWICRAGFRPITLCQCLISRLLFRSSKNTCLVRDRQSPNARPPPTLKCGGPGAGSPAAASKAASAAFAFLAGLAGLDRLKPEHFGRSDR